MPNKKFNKGNAINLDFGLMSIAFILALVLTYPYSPILFEFFIIDTHYSYAAYIVFSLFIIFLYKKDGYTEKISINIKEMAFYVCLMLGLSLSYSITGNNTALRDLLLLLFIICLVKILSSKNYIAVIRLYILIITFLLLISWIIILLYYIGFIDRLNWQIDNIYISENNPFVVRALYMDFEWSLLFNYAVLPFNPAVNYQRMTLIFLEPSGLADITFPLIFLVILDKKMPYRKILIAILLTSFLSAYSGWGLAVIFSSFVLGLFSVIFFRSTLKLFIFISFLFIIIISDYVTDLIKFLLVLLPNDKLTEFENKAEIGFINYSYLFGNYFGLVDIDELNKISAYGAEIVFYRYGIFGFVAYLLSFLTFIILSSKAASNWRNKFSIRIYSFIAIFGTTLMSLKTPSLLLVMPLLVHYYINNVPIQSIAYK